ncbi:TPR-like protein [Stemphylium lycopersici]|nr:TPR-like protein [Stemphylium lycopersici]
MDFPPRSLPDLAPAYLAPLELPHTGNHNAPAQQTYGLHGLDGVSVFNLQARSSGGLVATTQDYAPYPFGPLLQPGHMQYDAAFAGNNRQSALESTAAARPASSMGPPKQPRKPKAATLRAADWEPYKKRILELHIEQKKPLHEVKKIIEEEYSFQAELRQYRTRISNWGKDKNFKPQEMQAIVRKRQKRKLVETQKEDLVFEVRGSEVEPSKIERWMKRHRVADSFLYAPSPAASTPSAVGCHTISERGTPAAVSENSSPTPVLSPGGVYRTAQSPQMPSPALSVSSIMRPLYSAFAGQSPALTYRSLPGLPLSFVHDHSISGNAMDVGAQTRYRADEEERLRNQILIAEMAPLTNPLEVSGMLYELGVVLIGQGRYRAAEDVIRRILGSLENENSGSDHEVETLSTWDLLGQLLNFQGFYAKAERLHRRALQVREKVLGHEPPSTLTSMSNLAGVLDSQGKYKEAEAINRQTLAQSEKVLGQEHPNTLASMNNSALVLKSQGKYEEAEAINRQTLAQSEKVLGQEHPDTLTSVYHLANLLTHQQRYNESLPLYETACTGYQAVLGKDHPTTRACQQYYTDALTLYK